MRKQRHAEYSECPIEATLDLIGGKWKGALLVRLSEERRRFNELQRLLPKMTQRTLTNQLRELERDGLISRIVFPEAPPRVEYDLTDLGRTLFPVLSAMKAWGEEHVLALDPEAR